MNEKMPTVEDIERKQRLLSVLFKLFIAIIILIVCLFAAWLISFIGYTDDFSASGSGLFGSRHIAEALPSFLASGWLTH